jgi:hypothetical protein
MNSVSFNDDLNNSDTEKGSPSFKSEKESRMIRKPKRIVIMSR